MEDFEKALYLLDEKLEKLDVDVIEIKAIGGFAMMYYGFRDQGYTIDIDSLTKEFNNTVIMAIKEVGRELNLDEEWLNTDCAKLEGFLDELSSEINWLDSKYHFSHIDLRIADTVGLLRSKAKAIHDGGTIPRSTDKKDLLAGLRSMEIFDIHTLDNSEQFQFIQKQYTRCYDYLKQIQTW